MRARIVTAATLRQNLAETLTRPAARMSGMLLLGLLGLVLAAQGVYATAALMVEKRKFELAVRAALGASRRRLFTGVTGEIALSVTGGGVLGLAGWGALVPVLASWLGPAATWSLLPVAAAAVLLATAAIAGSLFPVRAALRADPMETLRQG